MIELRWLERAVPDPAHWAGTLYYDRVLQWRTLRVAVRSDNGAMWVPVDGGGPSFEWSDWRDVPVVRDEMV